MAVQYRLEVNRATPVTISSAGERLQDEQFVAVRQAIAEAIAVVNGLVPDENVHMAAEPSRLVDEIRRQAGMTSLELVDHGYVADHWCERGHVLYVLEGEIVNELRDGRFNVLAAGQGYVVADGDGAHRSTSPHGARLFIVD